MKKYRAAFIAAITIVGLTAACSSRGARRDLPQDSQELNEGQATVYLFPDKFPNVAHKCDGTTGMWTTTDRGLWVVYDDVLCGGETGGLVLSNIPGQRQAGDWQGVTDDEGSG